MKAAALAGAVVVLGLLALVAFREHRWKTEGERLVAQLRRAGDPEAPRVRFTGAQLEGLPAPAARYLRAVLREGQPLVRHARLRQTGQFLVRPAENGWVPFEAVQEVSTDPAGFVWSARMRVAPGVGILVRDALVLGRGSMVASVLAVFRLADVSGTPEIAEGALHRYLAEASWFPTALLPSAGVVWTPLDDASARATLTLGATTVSLDFHFGTDGLVQRVFARERAREVEGRFVPTPWQGRWSDYAERDGMMIPLSGEVEWLLAQGAQPYWRGRVTEVAYDR